MLRSAAQQRARVRYSQSCQPASGRFFRRRRRPLNRVAAQIAIAVENALAFKEIDSLKDKLAVEKLYLEEEIRSEFNFEEIIGESPAIKRALAQVELAAPATPPF